MKFETTEDKIIRIGGVCDRCQRCGWCMEKELCNKIKEKAGINFNTFKNYYKEVKDILGKVE